MKVNDAVNLCGNKRRLSKLLGVHPSTISLWRDRIPHKRQLQLCKIVQDLVKEKKLNELQTDKQEDLENPHEMKTCDAIVLCGGIGELSSLLEVSPLDVANWGNYIPEQRKNRLIGVVQGLLITKELNSSAPQEHHPLQEQRTA